MEKAILNYRLNESDPEHDQPTNSAVEAIQGFVRTRNTHAHIHTRAHLTFTHSFTKMDHAGIGIIVIFARPAVV